ncbi:unnamed protein product, partial [marine sediment metagenome]
PSSEACCPMAAFLDESMVKKFRLENPGLPVVTYINSTAAVKAESDICCTSSNAVKIVEKISKEFNTNAVLFELIRNISIKCSWVTCLSNFPYRDENSERDYNTLGYFQFEVEYYKDNPSKKESVKPMLIQQVPFILLKVLKEFTNKAENTGLHFDTESPIYIFLTSNKTKPSDIIWNPENIEKYKKVIGYWTEIYSGQWDDYSETLFDKRIQNNLSNRLSELHFIRRNSGFVYMAEENYEKFFKSYMKEFVLDPTPKMRAVLFSLR